MRDFVQDHNENILASTPDNLRTCLNRKTTSMCSGACVQHAYSRELCHRRRVPPSNLSLFRQMEAMVVGLPGRGAFSPFAFLLALALQYPVTWSWLYLVLPFVSCPPLVWPFSSRSLLPPLVVRLSRSCRGRTIDRPGLLFINACTAWPITSNPAGIAIANCACSTVR